jgi:hypothetical protein
MQEEGARHPTMATNEDNIECVYYMILLGRLVTIGEEANHLKISCGCAYEIFHSTLGFHKVVVGWTVNSRLWIGNIYTCSARKSSKANPPHEY